MTPEGVEIRARKPSEVLLEGEAAGFIMERAYYLRIAPVRTEDDVMACPDCYGAGYLRHERPVGHTLFGKYLRCPTCAQLAENVA